MRSRIFSSKYLKTISKGQLWMPAFIALGFLLAFPVTGMVKLSSWSDLQYSALQNQILYNNLWKAAIDAMIRPDSTKPSFHKLLYKI